LLQRPGSHAAAIRLPLADALGACSSISHLPFPQLAAAAQPLLEDLCARFLSGGDVLAPVVSPPCPSCLAGCNIGCPVAAVACVDPSMQDASLAPPALQPRSWRHGCRRRRCYACRGLRMALLQCKG
jgi:hypothetical protein